MNKEKINIYIDKVKNILRSSPRLLLIFGILLGITFTSLVGSIFSKNRKVENINNSKITYKDIVVNEDNNSNNNQDVVEYFDDTYNMIASSDIDDSSMVDKIKERLNIISNFLFDGGEINGYTYSELSEDVKIKINKLLLNIDSKIDEIFPNYKNKIKSSFKNLKAQVTILYLEAVDKICEGNRKEYCNEAKKDFNKIKKTFKITFSMIKDIIKEGKTDLLGYVK